MSGSTEVDMTPVVNRTLAVAACAMLASSHSSHSHAASPAPPQSPANHYSPSPRAHSPSAASASAELSTTAAATTTTAPRSPLPQAPQCSPPPRPQSAAYRRGRELGKGGFGHVFSGERIPDGLPVALKIIKTVKVNTWAQEVRDTTLTLTLVTQTQTNTRLRHAHSLHAAFTRSLCNRST